MTKMISEISSTRLNDTPDDQYDTPNNITPDDSNDTPITFPRMGCVTEVRILNKNITKVEE
jgi:hypothetical protein